MIEVAFSLASIDSLKQTCGPVRQVRQRRKERDAQKAEQRQRILAEQQRRAQEALAQAEELRPGPTRWTPTSYKLGEITPISSLITPLTHLQGHL